jgi:ribosomal protein S18 acetylase RimI-like enzyme
VHVTPACRSDAPAVAAVCLATARAGDPVDPDDPAAGLLAAVYAQPYLTLEPSSARLLRSDADDVVGYVLAAVDSVAFYRRWRAEWSPRFGPPEAAAGPEVRRLHEVLAHPERQLPHPATLATHPSHVHVDLLPAARGGGWGRRLLADAVAGLAAAGSPGVHLGVDPANQRALRFYRRCGFTPSPADRDAHTVVLVRDCSPLSPVTGGG